MPAHHQSDPGSADIVVALHRLGLIDRNDHPFAQPLTGGVASDIWRIDLPAGPVCLKRALEKLKVDADWHVPVDRNANEVAWMQTAHELAPTCVPEILAHDPENGLFVMAYLDPAHHPVWKSELRAGRANPEFAAQVGSLLGRIHAHTAGDRSIAERFASDGIFHAIRLEPYLEATATRHPDLSDILMDISRTTANNRRALVHGDVSPKNILVSSQGPVFLDAECAWYGDPAFDLTFCLKHMLLKCLWVPASAPDYLQCFRALAGAYLVQIDWEPEDQFQQRAVRLLPGLLLGRVDGKSPVEYLDDAGRHTLRRAATDWLRSPRMRLEDICADWSREMGCD